jgi:membrane protein
MKFKTQNIKSLFKSTFQEWKDDKAPKMAAAMAYYAVFSMGPLLLIALTVASIFFGEEAARTEMLSQISNMVGSSSSEAIAGMLQNIRNRQQTGLTAIVGIGTLLIAASGVFAELQDSLNRIWEIRPLPTKGFGSMIKKRLLSFGMVFSIGFLLLISLILTSMMEAGLKYVGSMLPGLEFIWQAASFVISFALVTVLFACMFRYLPDAKIAWRDLWKGSAITAAFFTLGKFGISLYLAHSATASTFGAAGSLVILLLWIYYSAQIFFFGAEFTQVYAKQYGQGIVPNAGAEKINKNPDISIRKDKHVNSDKSKSKISSGVKSFDDAVKKINELEQPLKNELLKTKLRFSRFLVARKYYLMATTVLGIAGYFYRQYRRKKYAEAN